MGYVVYKMTSFKYSEYRKTVPDKRSSQRVFQNQINFLFFFFTFKCNFITMFIQVPNSLSVNNHQIYPAK